jgi:multidrug efflux pump subunit AcrA (membrane-fusion protein)
MAPLFASVLVEKWLLHKKPNLLAIITPDLTATTGLWHWFRRRPEFMLIGAVLILALLFWFPLDYTVGGEAIITPWDRHLAFCKTDGLIEKVHTTEGSLVTKDQILATLDPTELRFKIESVEHQSEILAKRIVLFRREADTNPSKLGELKIVELERQKALKELQFLRWQAHFLEIRSPVDGIVLTKDIESLAGKKLKAGEPFCEIAAPGELAVEILVPEDRVAFAKLGQRAYCYLNANPLKGYELKVGEISPAAEALPRLGNVCRIRARFGKVPEELKVGMKGVGKIHTFQTNLWFVLQQGIVSRWNSLALYF